MRSLILAIDAGGSTTRCLIATSDGALLGLGTGGPANHILSGWETARVSLRDAVALALAAAGVGADRIAVAITGSAGVGSHGEGREPVESLLAEVVPGAAVKATGDMVTAFWGALAEPVGVVVAAGTGSVCFGRNTSGATCQVGGWGPVMGDEGSAYDIALAGLRAAACATDGRAPATVISQTMAAALGGRTALDVAARVYGEPLGRDQLAALAPAVTAAADAGDAPARTILAAAGEALALMAVTALRKLELGEAPAVSYAGAVFATDWVRAPFAAAVRAAASSVRIEPPVLPPLGGAFRLGAELLGEIVDDGVIARLRDGLARVESSPQSDRN